MFLFSSSPRRPSGCGTNDETCLHQSRSLLGWVRLHQLGSLRLKSALLILTYVRLACVATTGNRNNIKVTTWTDPPVIQHNSILIVESHYALDRKVMMVETKPMASIQRSLSANC